MVGDNSSWWGVLEPWVPTLFLVGGGLSVVHAAHHGLEAFTRFEYPLHHEAPFGAAGMVLGFVALLGLYPKLSSRSRPLAVGGAVFAVIGAVGWFVMGAMGLAEFAGVEPPAFLEVSGLLALLGIVLGYLLTAAVALRSDELSRNGGLVLLAPVLVMAVNISIVAAGYASPEGEFVVSSGFALALLAIGAVLRSEDGLAGRAEPAPRTAA